MKPSNPKIARRTLLRGAGVAMTLPWLESIPVWGHETVTGNDVAASPKRFAVLFMGCGINRNHWWARGSGKDMELGKSLAPMEPIKHKMNFITGLFNENATGVGIHPGQTGNILSGASLKKGSELRGDISMDQVLANHFQDQTAVPSLVLGCEQPVTGYHETNFSMAYSSHISWQNATSPVPMEVYPSLAFDALFDNQGSRRNESILDRVSEDAVALSHRVSAADRAKLDEYLSSVREVEKRAASMRASHAKAATRAQDHGKPIQAMKRPDDGLPEDIREHMQLMCDLVAIGFQTDKSRVATLLLNRDLSGLFYPFLDVDSTHHSASHSDTSDAYERISRYYCSQYAYLAKKLDSMQEGDSTVLDHSCLLFLSSMWSGNAHDSSKLPVLLTGGLSCELQTGRVLDYLGKDDKDRRMCSLYLSIMDRMGVSLDRFGDTDQRLAGI
jgi:nucleotide-binding universal stress UspA family protein